MPGEKEDLFTTPEPTTAELTAMLIQQNSPKEGSEEPSGDTSEEEGGEEEDLTTDDQGDDGDDTEDDDDQDGGDSAEDDADDEAEDDDEPEFVEIRDDDIVEVMVDGEIQEWTIEELKKAASGEGAIDKRLQEATELRKTAHAERTTMLETLYANETLFNAAVQAIESEMYSEMVKKPSAELKAKDPNRYLRHLDAYEADQERIGKIKTTLQAKVKELQKARADRLEAYGADAAKQLAVRIPALADPTKQGPLLESMTQTAKDYGYTPQEIDSALDPRMFHLVHDAMMYQRMKGKKVSKEDVKAVAQKTKTVRKLRSGSVAMAKDKARAQSAAQNAALDKARATGRPKDIAATLLVPSVAKRRK
jgi:hypothetical protein